MSRIRALGSISALALSLVACGGSLTSGDALSEAEAAELAEAVAEQGFDVGGFTAAAQQAAGMEKSAATTITFTINETSSCEGSGTASVVGTLTADFNDQTGDGTLSFSYTLTPTNCDVQTASHVFTLSGDPNLKVDGEFSVASNSFAGSATFEGGFAWESEDGRAGTCGVDLTVNYDFAFNDTTGQATGSASVTGNVCGHTVNRTVTVA